MTRERGPVTDLTKELTLYRKLIALASSIYLLWWFAVEAILSNSFNPFLGRFFVFLFGAAVLLGSYRSQWVQKNIRLLFLTLTWLITLHYYYLFLLNNGDINWVVGSFITVIAINLGMFSNAALLSYSVYVMALSITMVVLLPGLKHSVFLPGLATMLLQANMGLRSRLAIIKNLVESNERFQLLFNSTFEGVLVHEKGIIINVNNALCRMLGYSREELIGRNSLDILVPEKRAESAQKMSVADVGPYETKGLTQDGRIIELEIRAKDFLFNDLPARLVTIQDISDRKKAEQERIVALTMAENLRIRDDFISIASHELRTPLSALQLQVQLSERDLKAAPANLADRMKDSFALVERQVSRLTELVETLLDVSQISAGRFVLDIKKVDLAQLLYETIHSLPPANGSPNANSKIEIEAPEHAYISADPNRLGQVIENLVTNARKYGDGKPIRVTLTPHVSDIILTIQDHGLGIAPEFISRIFDRFERAISARNITGFGLGLYITRQIVEAHGGSIDVESKLGEGSTFTVRLPIEQKSFQSAPRPVP